MPINGSWKYLESLLFGGWIIWIDFRSCGSWFWLSGYENDRFWVSFEGVSSTYIDYKLFGKKEYDPKVIHKFIELDIIL